MGRSLSTLSGVPTLASRRRPSIRPRDPAPPPPPDPGSTKNIRILDGNIKTSDAQKAYIDQKVGAAASRLSELDFVIDVRLADLNGPRGGIDKTVSILLTPLGMQSLRVEERAAHYYAAIDAAAATLKRSIALELEKTKANGPR